MKQKFFSLVALLALPMFMFAQMALVPADTAGSPCDRHYESAVKFIVDTPVIHPFSINATGGKVVFSSGNLQYCPARDEWRFALRQFDRVGNGKQANVPAGSTYATANYGITTVFYDSIDYTKAKDDPARIISGIPCNNLLVSKNYEGWIDLFSWGTSGHGKKAGDSLALYFYPYDLNSSMVADENYYGYGPSFGSKRAPGSTNNIDTASGPNRWFDWGYGNHIREYSGCSHSASGALLHAHDSTMYRPGVWRTLTSAEWTYLLTTRLVAGNDSAFSYVTLKYGDNAEDTVKGVIIYPDDFSFAEAGVGMLKFGLLPSTAFPTIDVTTWEALQESGCVFLPGTSSVRVGSDGLLIFSDTGFDLVHYWTSTAHSNAQAKDAYWDMRTGSTVTTVGSDRFRGYPVRLVQDL